MTGRGVGPLARAATRSVGVRLVLLVLVGLSATVGVSGVLPARSQTAGPPSLVLEPDHSPAGASVTAIGTGFSPNKPGISLWIGADFGSGEPQWGGSVTPEEMHAGSFETEFRVPQDAVVGANTVMACGGTFTECRQAWSDFCDAGVTCLTVPFEVDPPTLVLDPVSGPAGASVTASGNGYGDDRTVRIYFDASAPSDETRVATVVADGRGGFDAETAGTTFRVPAGVPPGVRTVLACRVVVDESGLRDRCEEAPPEPAPEPVPAQTSDPGPFLLRGPPRGAEQDRLVQVQQSPCVGLAACATATFTVVSAPGPSGGAQLALVPGRGYRGWRVEASGSGFRDGTGTEIVFGDETVAEVPSGDPRYADETGGTVGFTAELTIPARRPGSYPVRACQPDCTDPGVAAEATFRILPPPRLVLEPAVGAPGFVTAAVGRGFPAGERVILSWSRGLGQTVTEVGADGTFIVPILIFHRDVLGERHLRVRLPGNAGRPEGQRIPTPRAAFLVVPGSAQPGDFVQRR